MDDRERWYLKHKIKELEEINKMLLKNMYHYEYRSRDAVIELMEAEEKISKLEALIKSKEVPE